MFRSCFLRRPPPACWIYITQLIKIFYEELSTLSTGLSTWDRLEKSGKIRRLLTSADRGGRTFQPPDHWNLVYIRLRWRKISPLFFGTYPGEAGFLLKRGRALREWPAPMKVMIHGFPGRPVSKACILCVTKRQDCTIIGNSKGGSRQEA